MKRLSCALLLCLLVKVPASPAQGPPIGGYSPFVGFGLTDAFKGENDDTFWTADVSFSPAGTFLGNGSPFFDVALFDTGASVSLLTDAAAQAFDLEGNGFDGTEVLPLGGATGQLNAIVTDPLGIFATGLANRTGTGSRLQLDTATMMGQTSVAVAAAPPESALPNVIGLPFASQFTAFIRADQPQIFRFDDRTIRTPQVELLPLGSGSQGITQRAPMTLKVPDGFLAPPQYIFNLLNILENASLTDNPSTPTVVGTANAGMFLTVDITNDGVLEDDQLFLFDTGASISAVSEQMAAELGFDAILDEPEFEVQVEGSGGTIESVPGFFADELKIATVGGEFVLNDVPLVVLDITDPSSLGNVVPGLIGTNVFADRNIVIEPTPSAGAGGVGPSVYISERVTTDHLWAARSSTSNWNTFTNWRSQGSPGPLWHAQVTPAGSVDQRAVVTLDSQIYRMTLAGKADGTQMEVAIVDGSTLFVFGGTTVQEHGRISLEGGTLDAQFVDLQTGSVLGGVGTVRTEFENRQGVIAPGDPVGELVLEGIFANRDQGTLAIDLGGDAAVTEHDVLAVHGNAFLGGTLEVSLVDLGDGLFRPDVGDEFEIIRTVGGDVLGDFDELILPPSYEWDLFYASDSVRLNVVDILELTGDYNGNGQVEQADLDLVLLNWGADAAVAPQGWVSDLPSGIVDQDELDRVLLNWGAELGGGLGAVSVPEPATCVLFAIAAVAIWIGRRR